MVMCLRPLPPSVRGKTVSISSRTRRRHSGWRSKAYKVQVMLCAVVSRPAERKFNAASAAMVDSGRDSISESISVPNPSPLESALGSCRCSWNFISSSLVFVTRLSKASRARRLRASVTICIPKRLTSTMAARKGPPVKSSVGRYKGFWNRRPICEDARSKALLKGEEASISICIFCEFVRPRPEETQGISHIVSHVTDYRGREIMKDLLEIYHSPVLDGRVEMLIRRLFVHLR